MSSVQFELYRLLGATPLLLVLFAGMLACLWNRRNRPAVAQVTAAALAVAAMSHFLLPYVLNQVFVAFLQGVTKVEMRVFIHSLASNFVAAVSWTLMLWVIFALSATEQQRREAAPPDVLQ